MRVPEMRARGLVVTATLVAAALAGSLAWSEADRASPYAHEKASVAGVANFGRVNTHLFRGAQPTGPGFAALRALGVDTILSLTLVADGTAIEQKQVEELGMRYVNVPMSATRPPTQEQISDFFAALADQPDKTVFVHCWQGADRTGVMIALYRIAHEGWTADQAVDEMRAFRFYAFFHPRLEQFVREFAERAD